MKIDRRLLKLAQPERLYLALAVLFGFLTGIVVVIQARYISLVIGAVFLGGSDLSGVQGMLLALLVVICLRLALVYASELAAMRGAVQITTRLRQRLFEHILGLGPAYIRQEQSGELLNTSLQGVDALEAYFSQYLPQIAIAALVPVTYLVLIFPLDAITGLVLLLTAPLIPVFMVLIGSLGESLTEKQWRTLSRLSAYFYDILQGLTTLKSLGRSREQAEVLQQVDARYRQLTLGVLRVTFLSALALEMIATLSTAIVAVEIGLRLLYGGLAYEQALFLLLLAPEFYLPLRSLGARFHAGMAGASAASRIFAVLDQPPPGMLPNAEEAGDSPGLVSVSVENLSFKYLQPGRRRSGEEKPSELPDKLDALRDISLDIPSGKVTALVGPSGGGKSTLANLLLGFITPSAGAIRVNGKSLEHLSPKEWRGRLAWVPQQPYIFNDTLLANIRLAKPGATLEEVRQAARRAHADEFIAGLPRGYETEVGEHGARLSAGQAQRIALARAFLKDAPFLILDEATSSIDPQLEALLQDSIAELVRGRTALVIAHRLSTVYRADCIYVMEAGRIVQSGSHAELMAQAGLYRELVRAYTGGETFHGTQWAYSPPGSRTDAGHSQAVSGSRTEKTGVPGNGTIRTAGHDRLDSGYEIWRRMLSLIAPHWPQILLSVLLGFLTIASGVGLMAASAYIISAAALVPSIAVLQVPIVAVRAFGISRGIFRYLERYNSHRTTFLILSRLRVWFYRSLEPLAPARLEGYRGGDLLARAIGDVASLEDFYVRGLAPSLVAVLVAGAAWLLLSVFSPSLGYNLLVFMLLAGLCLPLGLVWGSRSLGARLIQTRGELSTSLADGILGAADLLLSGQAGRHSRLVEKLNREYASLQGRLSGFGALQLALLGWLANLGMWVSLLIAIPLVSAGQLEGVYLAMVALVTLSSFEAVLPLPQAAIYLERDLAAAGRLFEIVDAPPQVSPLVAPIPPPGGVDIQVRNLSFRYPDPRYASGGEPGGVQARGSRDALHDLSFSLPAGKRLAIVGPSGAGKSTLVKLLLRYWEFERGELELDGWDIRLYQPEDIRRTLAVVEQNPYLFNTSLRENLLVANPSASQEDLLQAARLAGIDDFILSQPLGLDTLVGESGLRLSGGERQRLAIARALLRPSPVLILDEPTANLDALVERQIMDTVLQVTQGRTTLLITHRLAGLKAMDEILVLDQGRLVEQGLHHELVEFRGLYWHMWTAQNQILA